MYYIYGVSVPSLLIESTDSMIYRGQIPKFILKERGMHGYSFGNLKRAAYIRSQRLEMYSWSAGSLSTPRNRNQFDGKQIMDYNRVSSSIGLA